MSSSARTWDAYSRSTIDLASSATSLGFSALKTSTKLGFSITRFVTTTAVGLTTSLVDHALFGGAPLTRPAVGGAVSTALTLAEQLALAPIFLSEYLTSTSLIAAHSSINVLSVIFPGSSDASFSLASFISLVRREWTNPEDGQHLPENSSQFGVTKVARAIVAWVALQGVTQEDQEKKWFKSLREIHVRDQPPPTANNASKFDSIRTRRGSRIRVTSDIILPGNEGQLIAADIGEAPPPTRAQSVIHRPHRTPNASTSTQSIYASMSKAKSRSTFLSIPSPNPSCPSTLAPPTPFPIELVTLTPPATGTGIGHTHQSPTELKATLRRLSKMVLAGYGGASLLFFGVAGGGGILSPFSALYGGTDKQVEAEEGRLLGQAVDESEAEAAGEGDLPPPSSAGKVGGNEYSWWDVLLGRHDREIFERVVMGPGESTHITTVEVGSATNDAQSDGPSTSSAPKDAEMGPDKVRFPTPDAPTSTPAPISRKNSAPGPRLANTAVIGSEHQMPRFWVLTDHVRSEIVLVLRGTMSLNEIAVDLTCEPEAFQPASTPLRPSRAPRRQGPRPTSTASFVSTSSFAFDEYDYCDSDEEADDDEDRTIPGRFTQDRSTAEEDGVERPSYHVHSGMLRMARAMGDVGRPVQLAVFDALYRNVGYDLVLCGHSLGAGVAALLGLMWADPKTCLTVRSSGLPVGRRVSVYCFAPPCLTDAALSSLSKNLIVSFVYSHDVVSRISLGSVRDLKNAAMWLCANESKGKDKDEGYAAVTARAKKWKSGKGSLEDPDWFRAVRSTLEANMHMANMFPPGKVLWAMRDNDLHPAHRLYSGAAGGGSSTGPEKLRLFEVLDVEKVFGQIVFARDMLGAHMPHQYDRVLHDLL